MIASLLANKGDVMRAVDSFFESGGEMPKDGAKEELWAYWQEVCKRNVAVTMVLDFPFVDAVVPRGLNLLEHLNPLLQRL